MKQLYVQLKKFLWYNEDRNKTYIKKTTEWYVCYAKEWWKKVYLYNNYNSPKYTHSLKSISRAVKVSKQYLQTDTVLLEKRRWRIVVKKYKNLL